MHKFTYTHIVKNIDIGKKREKGWQKNKFSRAQKKKQTKIRKNNFIGRYVCISVYLCNRELSSNKQ